MSQQARIDEMTMRIEVRPRAPLGAVPARAIDRRARSPPRASRGPFFVLARDRSDRSRASVVSPRRDGTSA
jgi:hypothetical protein